MSRHHTLCVIALADWRSRARPRCTAHVRVGADPDPPPGRIHGASPSGRPTAAVLCLVGRASRRERLRLRCGAHNRERCSDECTSFESESNRRGVVLRSPLTRGRVCAPNFDRTGSTTFERDRRCPLRRTRSATADESRSVRSVPLVRGASRWRRYSPDGQLLSVPWRGGQLHRLTQSPPAARGVRVRVPSCAWVMLSTIARPRPTPA